MGGLHVRRRKFAAVAAIAIASEEVLQFGDHLGMLCRDILGLGRVGIERERSGCRLRCRIATGWCACLWSWGRAGPRRRDGW